MSPWGWTPERTQGVWRYGSLTLRPLVASAPWITLVLILLLFWFVGGTLVTSKGILFDLPEAGLSDGEATGPVVLIVPTARDTLVFFDDARYLLDDPASRASLAEHLASLAGRSERKTLLVLADRRVSGGDLMLFAGLARRTGIDKILFAEKKAGEE